MSTRRLCASGACMSTWMGVAPQKCRRRLQGPPKSAAGEPSNSDHASLLPPKRPRSTNPSPPPISPRKPKPQHKVYVGGKNLGKQVAVLPQKLGGGVSVLDLDTGITLASLWYSNYGDYDAIPHHIIPFPSENPYQEFELANRWARGAHPPACPVRPPELRPIPVSDLTLTALPPPPLRTHTHPMMRSCQGGLNTHLYNLQNVDPNPSAATNIYRLRCEPGGAAPVCGVLRRTGPRPVCATFCCCARRQLRQHSRTRSPLPTLDPVSQPTPARCQPPCMRVCARQPRACRPACRRAARARARPLTAGSPPSRAQN